MSTIADALRALCAGVDRLDSRIDALARRDAEANKPGDHIRVIEARTKGGKAYDIVIRQYLGGNKYRGEVLNGTFAGMTVVGEKIRSL